jgi:hypothetical protein
MNKNIYAVLTSYNSSDCFGDFNRHSQLCLKHCILSLRCAIEQDHLLRSALLEELGAPELNLGRIQ